MMAQSLLWSVVDGFLVLLSVVTGLDEATVGDLQLGFKAAEGADETQQQSAPRAKLASFALDDLEAYSEEELGKSHPVKTKDGVVSHPIVVVTADSIKSHYIDVESEYEEDLDIDMDMEQPMTDGQEVSEALLAMVAATPAAEETSQVQANMIMKPTAPLVLAPFNGLHSWLPVHMRATFLQAPACISAQAGTGGGSMQGKPATVVSAEMAGKGSDVQHSRPSEDDVAGAADQSTKMTIQVDPTAAAATAPAAAAATGVAAFSSTSSELTAVMRFMADLRDSAAA